MKLSFPAPRPLAALTVGRANVDFYPPAGEKLSATRRYDTFVGGSPANVAVGLVRRGLKSAILTRVGANAHGDFVASYLQQQGVDVSQIQRDPQHLTSLAFAERRPDSELLMYRQQAADTFLAVEQINRQVIATAQLLFVSGAAASSPVSRQAVTQAVQWAREEGTQVVLDIDYRPYNWGSSAQARTVLEGLGQQSDIILGTRAEFAVAGIKEHASDRACCDPFPQAQLVVVKHDRDGAHAFGFCDGQLCEQVAGHVFRVQVRKPWGAGDAFASSLLASLLAGFELQTSMEHAAAAAALNISGDSCTEAMSTLDEIQLFIRRNHAQTSTIL